ncbi:MAG TPA: class I SAM-dependent methyltransferase [Telluria sp.]
METQVEVRKAVWSRYWSHGIAHSCGGTYGNRYDGAIGQFWRVHFEALPAGGRVLDIATGNGAVPRLMLDSAADTVACDAVDLAQPEPQWIGELAPQQRARVRFHGLQAAESLPFPDASFDLVTSQYGLEYTDLERSVPEIRRVLRAGGKVCLLTHHADSQPVRLALTELSHLEWLLAPSSLLETGQGMIEPMARAATDAGRASLATDAGANALRARFNMLQTEATRLAASSGFPDLLGEVRVALAEVLNLAIGQGASAAGIAFASLAQGLADSRVRLEELREFALDDAAARRLASALGGDPDSAVRPIVDDGKLMGWGIEVGPL